MADAPLETFYWLKDNGTYIRLRIPGRSYERLVVVSAIQTDAGKPLLAIDCPDGLTDVLSAMDELRLDFEFTGEDELGYRFSITQATVQGDTFMIAVPTDLQRVQRRKDYRLTAPLGAVFYVTTGDQRKRVKMLDLSASGTSGILISLKSGTPQPPPFEIGQTLFNLKLELPGEDTAMLIPIRECEVRRVEDLPQRGRYRLAVAFTSMDTEHRTILKEYLYDQQRHMLKIRQQRQ